MRVLQLIDSLEAGGAERVAVNIANALSTKIDKSFLCATRKEGALKNSIDQKVHYTFLNKCKTIDIVAIRKLNDIVKENKITIIHAHSSSFFLATLISILNSNLKVVWHDHYGNSEFLNQRKATILKLCSYYFAHIFSVNKKLKKWATQNLKVKSISYLPNFAVLDKNEVPRTTLFGKKESRIVHLANLRPQKDHRTLIKAFHKIAEKHPYWSLHCVGKDFDDNYSKAIKQLIIDLNLKERIFIYGSKPDISYILKQCKIGVLSSKSEGLPISLLEYGLNELAVVVTNVGECASVVAHQQNGLVVAKENANALAEAICSLIENIELRNLFANRLNMSIIDIYSKEVILVKLVNLYKSIEK